ncbi:MAG: sigma-70 family RNA polymerase sigma factor [Candidatus Hydrogenedentes bacterium]|nr:sigma-70 family RNA polymerase sigma factor [Candidatus Hydrogenedentota bacterium]
MAMTPVDVAYERWVRSTLDRYEGPLIRYAARITGDLEQARDVVQDTFLRLCKADQARVEDHMGEWLFTVCRNRALDVVRKERRMNQLTETQAAQFVSRDPSPSAVAERRETTSRVVRVLETLSKNQQEVVRLRFQNGMSYKEISRITGHSVSNVGFLIHAAIKTLRQRLRTESDLVQEAGGSLS